MEEFLKAFVQGVLEGLSLAVYLWIVALIIFYVLLVLFGFNLWTYFLGNLLVFVVGTAMSVRWEGR